jgi:hypothetical protein
LLILILISLPAIACQDRQAPLLAADELLGLDDDQDQSGGDDDQETQPQGSDWQYILDDLEDPICCNLCDPLTGMPLAPYVDMSQVAFSWVISDGSCNGEFVLTFERAENLRTAFMGGLTFYDPSGPLLMDDPFCWGRYGNISYGFYTDSSGALFPNYAYLDPDTMQWVVGDAPGYEVLTDTTEITLRIPCDQINHGYPWMIHTAEPGGGACDAVGQGPDGFPIEILADIEF